MLDEKVMESESRLRLLERILEKLDKKVDKKSHEADEKWIDHQVRIRLQSEESKQLRRTLYMILGVCGASFTAIIVPILLHASKLA